MIAQDASSRIAGSWRVCRHARLPLARSSRRRRVRVRRCPSQRARTARTCRTALTCSAAWVISATTPGSTPSSMRVNTVLKDRHQPDDRVGSGNRVQTPTMPATTAGRVMPSLRARARASRPDRYRRARVGIFRARRSSSDYCGEPECSKIRPVHRTRLEPSACDRSAELRITCPQIDHTPPSARTRAGSPATFRAHTVSGKRHAAAAPAPALP